MRERGTIEMGSVHGDGAAIGINLHNPVEWGRIETEASGCEVNNRDGTIRKFGEE